MKLVATRNIETLQTVELIRDRARRLESSEADWRVMFDEISQDYR